MITKDTARMIWHCYNEIDEARKMIDELKKSINEKGEFEFRDRWGDRRGLELHVPTSSSGHTIRRVPFELALDVIQKHIESQESELLRLKEVCRIQLV